MAEHKGLQEEALQLVISKLVDSSKDCEKKKAFSPTAITLQSRSQSLMIYAFSASVDLSRCFFSSHFSL